MQAVPVTTASQLEWVHVPGTHAYQLLVGSQHFGTLTWQKGTGSIAAAESSEGRWTLKRRGFLWPGITVRSIATRRDLAVLRAQWRESSIQTADGRTFRWARSGFTDPSWKVTDADGREMLSFEPRRRGKHLEGCVVTSSTEAGSDPALLLLLIL
ncbi:MAG TPA: hypothetical protein VML53_02360, partial [Thermoplasmata archaeon]|nr:hypothetical protein [Thermoplasmata archaeon]